MNKFICNVPPSIICFALSFFSCFSVLALPTNYQVIHGNVTVNSPDNANLQIQQDSNQAIVNWSNFNIAAGERVHFRQPNGAICLNRIDATNGMSSILGDLSATSKIILVNKAGILFSESAHIDIGGIIASSVDIADASFLGANLVFDSLADKSGAIINRGIINVHDNGLVVLFGNSVSNEGIIAAKYSQILLASGDTITVDFNGDGLINFALDSDILRPASKPAIDENGNNIKTAVNLSGKISNEGGDVIIMASAAPEIFDQLINLSGEVSAKTISKGHAGVILIGDQNGMINIDGNIDVRSATHESHGGGIIVVGNEINISDDSNLYVHGDMTDGYVALGDAFGHVKTYGFKDEYTGKHLTKSIDTPIPTITTAFATKLFNDYKYSTNHPEQSIMINIASDPELPGNNIVNIDLNFNDTNINMRSIRQEDHEMVHRYLNSQPLVRQKYSDGQTTSAEYSKNRVQVLADRFNLDVKDGCYMHGGFIVTDKDTGQFLGIANSGTSLENGVTEIAFMYRPDAWNHKPDNLYTAYNIEPNEFLHKDYQGVGTAVVCGLTKYSNQLKSEGNTIKGEPITGIRASSRVDNPASWKVLAKSGFDLDAVRINEAGVIRYRALYYLE